MKTLELTGATLDWAGVKAEGLATGQIAIDGVRYGYYNPSTDQAQGGSIIDREGISTVLLYGNTWGATTYNVQDIVLDRNEAHYQGIGPTRLIAAMRCFVASKFGDEVELPKELI